MCVLGGAQGDLFSLPPPGPLEAGGGGRAGAPPTQRGEVEAMLRAEGPLVRRRQSAMDNQIELRGRVSVRHVSPICRNSKRRRRSKIFALRHFYRDFFGS